MSSFSRVLRIGGVVLALGLLPALAACTGLTPVYGDNGLGAQRVEVRYAAPANRLEQIIYQDLALRLGKADREVPTVRVRASRSGDALTSGGVSTPTRQRQITVTARITVTDAAGATLFSGSRSQSADYTSDAQSLASQQAADDAANRAARLLADTIRLEVIAALMK